MWAFVVVREYQFRFSTFHETLNNREHIQNQTPFYTVRTYLIRMCGFLVFHFNTPLLYSRYIFRRFFSLDSRKICEYSFNLSDWTAWKKREKEVCFCYFWVFQYIWCQSYTITVSYYSLWFSLDLYECFLWVLFSLFMTKLLLMWSPITFVGYNKELTNTAQTMTSTTTGHAWKHSVCYQYMYIFWPVCTYLRLIRIHFIPEPIFIYAALFCSCVW